jgi:hypothetical protein
MGIRLGAEGCDLLIALLTVQEEQPSLAEGATALEIGSMRRGR